MRQTKNTVHLTDKLQIRVLDAKNHSCKTSDVKHSP